MGAWGRWLKYVVVSWIEAAVHVRRLDNRPLTRSPAEHLAASLRWRFEGDRQRVSRPTDA
jgi:hypothetical protein